MTINYEFGTITANRAVLNDISIMAYEAARYNQTLGATATAKEYDELHDMIYKMLEESGYYK